jgi:CBS domain-containing protein
LVLGQALGPAHSIVAAMLVYLGSTNLLLGIFNLIPGFPLDGGRVLRSIIWRVTGDLRTATRWASRIGQIIAYLFILFGVMEFFSGNLLGGIWFGFIGWFLLSAAQTANQQVMLESMLRGVTVRDVMAPPPYPISTDFSLQQLVDGYIFPYGLRSVPVTEGDRFAGLVTLQEIRSVPQEQWPTTRVGQVMVPVAKLLTVEPGRSLSDALHDMAAHDVGQVPVVADGQLVGMLSRDRVLNALAVRRSLGARGSTQSYPQPPAPSGDQPRLPGGTAPSA